MFTACWAIERQRETWPYMPLYLYLFRLFVVAYHGLCVTSATFLYCGNFSLSYVCIQTTLGLLWMDCAVRGQVYSTVV